MTTPTRTTAPPTEHVVREDHDRPAHRLHHSGQLHPITESTDPRIHDDDLQRWSDPRFVASRPHAEALAVWQRACDNFLTAVLTPGPDGHRIGVADQDEVLAHPVAGDKLRQLEDISAAYGTVYGEDPAATKILSDPAHNAELAELGQAYHLSHGDPERPQPDLFGHTAEPDSRDATGPTRPTVRELLSRAGRGTPATEAGAATDPDAAPKAREWMPPNFDRDGFDGRGGYER